MNHSSALNNRLNNSSFFKDLFFQYIAHKGDEPLFSRSSSTTDSSLQVCFASRCGYMMMMAAVICDDNDDGEYNDVDNLTLH